MQGDLDAKIETVAAAHDPSDKKNAAKIIFQTIKEKNITLDARPIEDR